MFILIKCILLFSSITSGKKDESKDRECQSKILNLTDEAATKNEDIEVIEKKNTELTLMDDASNEPAGHVNTHIFQLHHILAKMGAWDRIFDFLTREEVQAVAMINKSSMKSYFSWLSIMKVSCLVQRELKKESQIFSTFYDPKQTPQILPFTLPIKDWTKLFDRVSWDNPGAVSADFQIQLSPEFKEITFRRKKVQLNEEWDRIKLVNKNDGDFQILHETWISRVEHEARRESQDCGSFAKHNIEVRFNRQDNSVNINGIVHMDNIKYINILVKPESFNKEDELIQHVIGSVTVEEEASK